jgi:hypothetical protein
MRAFVSWSVGIVSFFGLMAGFSALGAAIGVPVQIFFDEPIIVSNRYYEEEHDSAFTSFGYCVLIVSIMVASRIGMAVSAKSWRGGLDFHEETKFQAWFFGLLILGCFSALLDLAFRDFHGKVSRIIFNVLELGAAAGIFWAMKTWHDLRVHRYDERERRLDSGGSKNS